MTQMTEQDKDARIKELEDTVKHCAELFTDLVDVVDNPLVALGAMLAAKGCREVLKP